MGKLLIKETRELAKDEVIDLTVWQVPKSAAHPLGLKYSFNYRVWNGREWIIAIRYDNAHGTGDHRHVFDVTEKIAPMRPSEIYRDILKIRKKMEDKINEIKKS